MRGSIPDSCCRDWKSKIANSKTVAISERPGSAMTTIVVVALMVDPSHSVAGKTDTPELVREDTGRQAQQSYSQYAVAPAGIRDDAVVALHNRASSLRI